jgi:hypothetical protein
MPRRTHEAVITGGRRPDRARGSVYFWVNTAITNLRTAIKATFRETFARLSRRILLVDEPKTEPNPDDRSSVSPGRDIETYDWQQTLRANHWVDLLISGDWLNEVWPGVLLESP